MQAKLIKIGNSFGVRLPKTVIEACEFTEDLDLVVRGKSVVLTAEKQPRAGWHEAIQDEITSKPLRYLGEWEW
ncbi:MAG: AbrB/MazE/SpoVT family DNA-binding domain-containing protein [Alphaproteobacteria bacterium]|nr:AbrB/MazE/SpoVT family DNA-binding domain-containing protein [Alphaproteobacteria bacterium]